MLYTVRHYIDYGDKIKSRPKKEFDTAKEAVEYANSIEIDVDTDRIAVFEGCGDAFDEEIYTIDSDGDITDRREKFVKVAKLEEVANLTSKEMVAHINENVMGKHEEYDANFRVCVEGKPFNSANKEVTHDPFNPNLEDVYLEYGSREKVRESLGRHRTIAIKGTGVEDSFWVYSCSDMENHIWTATHWSMEKVEE